MTIDTTKLRELAQKATPGSWYSKWPEERCTWVDIGNSRYPVAYTGDCFDDAPNAEYIAAANPATVLEILNELALLEFDLASARQIIEHQNERIAELEAVKIAAQNLAKVRGRHNSELAMDRLLEALE